ncbi:MAG: hypothetical protein HKN28_02905 [Alphaproteobacteria bacterium]|nr:hypothetical protein [Alphaproteobacteria bacterium]
MIRHQEVTEFFGREWQSISGAPITFIIAVLIGSVLIGILFGLISWKLGGRSARSKINRLLELKLAEDDVLAQVRAKHDYEIEVREEIEVELERLQGAVRRLHDSDLSPDQLIVDASIATTKAVEVLKRSQDEFVQKIQSWDRQRVALHEKASADRNV